MTIAQIRANRLVQLRKLISVMRTYNTKQEALDRLLRRYRGKKTIIESNDMPAIATAFQAMNANFSQIETELTGLINLVGKN